MQLGDPENPEKPIIRRTKHKDHHDLSRWHLLLHPSVTKQSAMNSFPGWLGHTLHPTKVTLTSNDGKQHLWRSRSHRKNLYRTFSEHTVVSFSKKITNFRHIEYWNVSWWVAVGFTLGSIVWVVNGFVSFLPFCITSIEKADHSQGWTAFLGATIFEISSIFGIWEAWNRDDVSGFGWHIKDTFSRKHQKTPHASEEDRRVSSETERLDQVAQYPRGKAWIWFSTDTKYFTEAGFLAAFFQLLGATIFWISGFTAIPSIQSVLKNNTGLGDGVYWTPQVVGGSGFMISSIFIMLESQTVWWKPVITSLGWQVGLWNFIGAIGFTLSGALGYANTTSSGAEYQTALTTFWGGWAFLIGSVIQWYEVVNPYSQ